MKLINLITALLVMALFACNDSTTKQEESKKIDSSNKGTDAPKTDPDKKVAPDSSKTVTAKFKEFVFGDISHFIFIDEAGKEWDFIDNKDTAFKFEIELPKSKSNTNNRGWSSNKTLQGKSFVITYILKDASEYPDPDPVAGSKVMVITHVTPK